MNNDTNFSQTTMQSALPWYTNPTWTQYIWYAFVWLFPTLCWGGGCINLLCFIVILRHSRAFPFATRLFMLIISASDVLTLLFRGSIYYFGLMTTKVGEGAWTWYTDLNSVNLPLCMLNRFITFYALYGASFFQLGLTIDRVIAVTMPLQAKLIFTPKRVCILAGVLAVFSLLFPVLETCNTTWTSQCAPVSIAFNQIVVQLELYVGRLALGSLLLLGTLVVCDALIRSSRRAPSDADAAKWSKDAARLSFLLIFLNVNFLAFSLPWSMVNTFSDVIKVEPSVVTVFNTLLYMNSAINWLAYFIGGRFRGYFACTFCCRKCHLHRSTGSSTSLM